MWKLYLLLVLSLFAGIRLSAQVTLEECVKLAQDNYPLIRKYDDREPCRMRYLLSRNHWPGLSVRPVRPFPD